MSKFVKLERGYDTSIIKPGMKMWSNDHHETKPYLTIDIVEPNRVYYTIHYYSDKLNDKQDYADKEAFWSLWYKKPTSYRQIFREALSC